MVLFLFRPNIQVLGLDLILEIFFYNLDAFIVVEGDDDIASRRSLASVAESVGRVAVVVIGAFVIAGYAGVDLNGLIAGLGITGLAYTPNKSQRDQLYKADVNPIANIPGQGTLLYGDKTMLGRPSAFDRVNVRRLFLILERAIGRAAQQVLFEFNDEFTRAEFVNIVEPVLREVQGRRGITDFRVVCDETNNTPAIVDRNEFIANIFIKPARSINFVTLNFVAVRTGVDFEEVVGTG